MTATMSLAPDEFAEPVAPEPVRVTSPVEFASARDAAGMSITQLSERLRIDPARLAALESGAWDRLPSRAFARAGLRSVAREIGVDATPLIESIGDPANVADLRMGMRPQAAVPVITASMVGRMRQHRSSSSGWGRWAVPVGACGAGLLGLVLFAGGNDDLSRSGGTSRVVSVPVPGADRLDKAPVGALVPVGTRPAIRVTQSVSTGSGGGLAGAPAALASAGLAGQQVGAALPVKAEIRPAGAAAGAIAEQPAITFPVKLPPTEPVELRFDAKAWVDIRHKDGEKLLFGTQKAGKRVVLQGVPPMKVVIGNPDGVKMRFRGEPVDLKATIKKGVSRLVLN